MQDGQVILFFLQAVAEQYGRQPLALHPLRCHNPARKQLYHVEFANEPAWVMRAYHPSFIEDPTFPWLSRYPTLFEWLHAHATILDYLAQQRYPAPHVISTRTGAWIGTHQEWYILMTSFVDGDAKEATPAKIQALGASLGFLHTLHLPGETISKNEVGKSWWEPVTAISYALHHLSLIAEHIPAEWREAYAAFRSTFLFFQQRPQLLRMIIHGDCWAENGIRTQGEMAILIDWECAGSGLAIVDLGSLLLHCHWDQFDNAEYQPDIQRIAAVARGYCQWRQLPPDELAILVEAVRFSIAWRGALILSLIEYEGWHERLHQSLTQWWRWYTISEEIAHIAHPLFEHGQ